MASTISAGTSAGTAIAIAGDTTGALALQTNNGTTAVTIDTSQNVGIGTASPASSLDIRATDARSILRLTANTATNPVYQRFSNTGGFLYVGMDGSGGSDFGAGAYASAVWATGAYPIVFGTSATERMRIDSSGNLFLGTTTQNDNGKFNINFTSAVNACIGIKQTNNSTGTLINFINYLGNSMGYIGGSVTSTSYNTTSDYRLKENIAPMTGALNKVQELKPVTYTWKSTGKSTQGFIAHELQAVVPECVTGEKDAVNKEGKPVYQGIDTSFLVATLTAAIQELNAKVDAQATIIAELQAKVGA
jgi:Chaperone of endosialidase